MDIPRNPIISNGIELPYKAGTKISEAEATFLNKKVMAYIRKLGTEEGFDMAIAEPEHFFPVKATRTPGLRSDPAWVFALEIMTEKIRARLVEQEKVLPAREITALAKEALNVDPSKLEKARVIWAERTKLMDETEIGIS